MQRVLMQEGRVMLRKMMIALFAAASVAMLVPETASARGGFRGGGGFHGGGFHGGGFRAGGIGIGGGGFRAAAIGGGGFRAARAAVLPVGAGFRGGNFAGYRGGFHRGFRNRGFPIAAAAIVGAGVGYGLYGPYGYYGGYDDAYPYDANYGYDNGYSYGDGGCYVVQQQVMTPYGWSLQPVQVCN
jgi:hypothetical protein